MSLEKKLKILSGKKIIILAEEGFDAEELWIPKYQLEAAGAKVVLAGSGRKDKLTKEVIKTYNGKRGSKNCPPKVTVNRIIANAKTANYDGVIIPGGYECPARLRNTPSVVDFVREMSQQEKLVAAICHGPQVMISAGIVRERSITGYEDYTIDLLNAGAIVKKKETSNTSFGFGTDDKNYSLFAENLDLVVDRNFITARHYAQVQPFCKAIINYLLQT